MTENIEFNKFGDHLLDLSEYDCEHEDYCLVGYGTVYFGKVIRLSEKPGAFIFWVE
jgi:hypothetical protein